MKAVTIDRFGGSDVLLASEQAVIEPGPGEILVRTAYASVNPADWKGRSGLLPQIANMYSFPVILGMDASGVVERIGDGVVGFAPKDRIVTASGFIATGRPGTYAEFCTVPVTRTFHAPPALSLAEAATIPIAGSSAASSVIDVARVQQGDRVLVHGGSGAVGNFAVQLLKFLGADVAATCHSRNADRVKSLGADIVIAYDKHDVHGTVSGWAPEGVAAIIDAVGQGALPPAIVGAVRPGGTVVCIQNLLSGIDEFDLELAALRNVRVIDNIAAAVTPVPANMQMAALRVLLAGIELGRIGVPPIEILPFDSVAEAHDRIEGGHAGCKLLLEIGGEDVAGRVGS